MLTISVNSTCIKRFVFLGGKASLARRAVPVGQLPLPTGLHAKDDLKQKGKSHDASSSSHGVT